MSKLPSESPGSDEAAELKRATTLDSLWPGTLLAMVTSITAIIQSNSFLFEQAVRSGLLDFVLIAQVPLLYFWCMGVFRIRRYLHSQTETGPFSVLVASLATVMTSSVAPPLAHIFGGGIIGKAIEVFISMPVFHMPPSGIRHALMVGLAVAQMLLVFLSIFGSCAYVIWGNVSLVSRITNFINSRTSVAINPLLQQIFVASGMAAPFVWYLFNMGRDPSDSVYFAAQSVGFAVAFIALGELNEKLRRIEVGAPVSRKSTKAPTKGPKSTPKATKPAKLADEESQSG